MTIYIKYCEIITKLNIPTKTYDYMSCVAIASLVTPHQAVTMLEIRVVGEGKKDFDVIHVQDVLARPNHWCRRAKSNFSNIQITDLFASYIPSSWSLQPANVQLCIVASRKPGTGRYQVRDALITIIAANCPQLSRQSTSSVCEKIERGTIHLVQNIGFVGVSLGGVLGAPCDQPLYSHMLLFLNDQRSSGDAISHITAAKDLRRASFTFFDGTITLSSRGPEVVDLDRVRAFEI